MSNSEETTHQDPQASSEKTFTEKFTEERAEWTKTISEISNRFRVVENLAEVQIDLYSKRQIAIEYQYKLIGIHSKLKKMLIVEWKNAYEKAGHNEDIRYSEKEKTKFAEAATVELKYKSESLSSQIDFFRDTVKTIDNMIFGVKHRIEIENFKAGMK
jgi:hypothetical protein